MIVKVLIENNSPFKKLKGEHGLSLYVETDKTRFLFDMGQSDFFAQNAQKMDVDLSKINFAIVSHGHYDHGGGLRTFLRHLSFPMRTKAFRRRSANVPPEVAGKDARSISCGIFG